MNLTDKELVESAQQGEVDSFRILYERYWTMAVSLAKSRVFDRHLAEDVAQESFVAACRQLATLKDGSCFPSWLSTIVRRIANKMPLRKTANPADFPEPIASVLGDSEERDLLADAIAQLPESQREAVYLRYFGDLTYEEIAAAINSTTASVHGLLQRARVNLSKKFGKLSNG